MCGYHASYFDLYLPECVEGKFCELRVDAVLGSLFAGALADLAGIVPLLNSSALLYCGAGLLALFLLTPGKDRKTTD